MTTGFILSIGPRGEVEPTIVLAARLLNRFQAVRIFHLSDYENLIPNDSRLISHPFPFSDDFQAIFKDVWIESLLPSVFTPIDMTKIQTASFATYMADHVVPLLPRFINLAEQHHPSVIISTILGFPVAMTVADKCRIPLCVLNIQPNTPTIDYPCYMHSIDAIEEIAKIQQQEPRISSPNYLDSYESLYSMFSPSISALNEMRTSYGLDKFLLNDLEDSLCGKRRDVHVINGYIKELVPDSSHHTVHIVPPFTSCNIPHDWTPAESCPEVVEFLEKEEDKPICITFGSTGRILNSTSAKRQLLNALNGARSAGLERALILNGTTNIGTGDLRRFPDQNLIGWVKDHNVLVTKEAPPFSWLLPNCKAIICHGGAGTSFAGLRAGIPVIISPLMSHHLLWARLIEQLGLGVAAPELLRASSLDFGQAIKKALDDEIVERVRQFGEDQRNRGDGASIAADIVSSLIST